MELLGAIYLVMIMRMIYLCTKYREEISAQLGVDAKTEYEKEVAEVLDNPAILGLLLGLFSPAIILMNVKFAKFFFSGNLYER